jgi:threonine/homoserine/homoserine lactone efflux protein
MYFLKGLLFGLVLQLSVGPVCFAVLHRAITNGFREAFKMVLGVALVDGIYILISFTGIGLLLKIYVFKKIILILGALVLSSFGIIHLKNARKKNIPSPKINTNNSSTMTNSFLYAIGLTAINPLTIIFWSGVFGTLITSSELVGLSNIILYSLGCISSTIIFLSFIGLIGKLLLKKVNNKVLSILDYIVGIILILFSIKLIIS